MLGTGVSNVLDLQCTLLNWIPQLHRMIKKPYLSLLTQLPGTCKSGCRHGLRSSSLHSSGSRLLSDHPYSTFPYTFFT
uniref:Uncharacterized protein n=1 Tax=Anguilla anguilla TaxID=7936 RepID=A0A0E9WS46_ANGAN